MTKMTDQIVKIAQAGGSIELDANDKMTDQLIKIAQAVKVGGGSLRLLNADSKMTDQLVKIAQTAPGRVTFVL